MIHNPWLAVSTALVLWWLSTGLIMLRVRRADNGGRDQHLWSVILGFPLLIVGVGAARETLNTTSVEGVYVAFLSALAIWGWIELAFLSGIITGPKVTPCPPDATGWARFKSGLATLIWHEALLLAAFVMLFAMTRGAENVFALWTFGVLFGARILAKLNLFFGVPRINTEFLPRPLSHLASHFRRGPITLFFPVSVTLLSFVTAFLLERFWQATTPGAETGFTLLIALTLLALLEHWFMVLPLPDQKLWRWMLPALKPLPKDRLSEDANGL